MDARTDSDRELPPAAQPSPNLERAAWESLRACAALAEGLLSARVGTDTGLSVARLEALNELFGQPEGLSMGQLARALRMSNANATALVDGLERAGWVAREAVPGDRRQTQVRLTGGGQKGFAALLPGFQGAVKDLFSGLSDSELRLLHALLFKLRTQLGAEQTRIDHSLRVPQAPPASPKPFGWGWV